MQLVATKGERPAVLEFGSLEGILGCVAAGMGITLLPAAVVNSSALKHQVRTHALPQPTQTRNLPSSST
ncbi:hypothetical protein KXR78_11850 [Microbacterium barkeri]